MGIFAPRYVFRSRWELASPPSDVFDALYDLANYPGWWPQVRAVHRFDEDHHKMVVRSFLPYEIDYTLIRETSDRAQGLLRGRVEGDIVGTIEWRINPSPSGCVAYFFEDVETTLEVLNLLAPVARWMFEFNHQLMMRDGHLGLSAYVSGRTLADRAPGTRAERRM